MKRESFIHEGELILPVRLYHALSSLLTLAAACTVSGLLVSLWSAWTDISPQTALVVCCVLTILIGGFALAWEAKYYIGPAKAVYEASEKVAAGDFDAVVPLPKWRIVIREGRVLIDNFNRMVRDLKANERIQRDFISSVSHEFKTPLSSIAGFAEILKDGGISSEEQQEYLELMYDESLRLSRLAENILRLSRLDAQAIVTRREKVAVDEQIRRTLILLTERLSGRETVLDIMLPEITVESDPDMLEQIWLNLIDNALKYSPVGKTLHITGEILDGAVSVHIRDEGNGIPDDKIPHIFERFYQCEESHKPKGNGLGLSIVLRIVEILGGSIECHSELGIGTEMIVSLPQICKIDGRNIKQ